HQRTITSPPRLSFGHHLYAQPSREARRPRTSAHGKASEPRRSWLAKTFCHDLGSLARGRGQRQGSRQGTLPVGTRPGMTLASTTRAPGRHLLAWPAKLHTALSRPPNGTALSCGAPDLARAYHRATTAALAKPKAA